MTILLVEAEARLASFIQKGAATKGYDPKVAYDGAMGQRLFDQQPFDVVVLDVNLPGLNGFELCRYREPVLRSRALARRSDAYGGQKAFCRSSCIPWWGPAT